MSNLQAVISLLYQLTGTRHCAKSNSTPGSLLF